MASGHSDEFEGDDLAGGLTTVTLMSEWLIEGVEIWARMQAIVACQV